MLDIQKFPQEIFNETEGLKKQNAELQNESAKITRDMEELLQVETKMRRETEEQFTSITTELNNYRKSQQEMLNEIEELRMQDAELRNEKENIVTNLEKSVQVEPKMRRETKEHLTSMRTELNNYRKSQQEMLNETEGLKKQNTKQTNDRDKIIRNIEELRLWIEGFASSNNPLEPNFTELREVTNDFNDLLKIGEGGYGSVYKTFLALKPVAIKILRRESHHGKREFNQEVTSIGNFVHPDYYLNTLHLLFNIIMLGEILTTFTSILIRYTYDTENYNCR